MRRSGRGETRRLRAVTLALGLSLITGASAMADEKMLYDFSDAEAAVG